MKKLLAMILALVMALSLVACGDSGSSGKDGVDAGSNKSATGETDKDVLIDMWGVWAEDNARVQHWVKYAEEFAAAYEAETGISVEFMYANQDGYDGVAEKLAAGATSKVLPVISQIEEQQVARFGVLGADLSKYLSAEAIDNYNDGLLVSCYLGDTLKAVPGGRSYSCVLINKVLLEKAGYTVEDVNDWTQEEMVQIAADITALGDGIYGYSMMWDTDAWILEGNIYSYGESIDNEDGTKITVTPETIAKILFQFADMMNKGTNKSFYNEYAPGDVGDGIYDLIAQGKLGMWQGSCTSYKTQLNYLASYEGEKGEVETLIARQPKGTEFGCVTGGSNIMIMDNATETQKKVAAAFLEYLQDPAIDAAWYEVSSYLPVTDSVYDDAGFAAKLEADPQLARILEYAGDAHARPTSAMWSEMYQTVLMPKLVELSQKPENYATYDACLVMAQEMVDGMQKIIDENA